MKKALRRAGTIVNLAVLIITVGGVGSAQTQTTLHSFCPDPVFCTIDGLHPEYETLVLGSDGNFYGTTAQGGVNGCGTVFQITSTGQLTSFSLPKDPTMTYCVAGAAPRSGLILGTDGNFYGTAQVGGVLGGGTVFSFSPDGTFTPLYNFRVHEGDGDAFYPGPALVQGSDGNFYGMTGASGLCTGCGTIFQITPGGTLTTVHYFQGADGSNENTFAAMVQGSDGNFYGTTANGGQYGYGTVFTMTPDGGFTSLYSFQGPPDDGAFPQLGLVQGSDGNFYGASKFGGPSNSGTIYRITPDGVNTILHTFGTNSPPNDGGRPHGPLILGTDGSLYGTASVGGVGGGGTVFQFDPTTSTLTVLASFHGAPSEGNAPYGGLVQDSSGGFYGTTLNGGTTDRGTVFSLTRLAPSVR